MFLICLLLMALIAIENQKEFLSAEQAEFIPVRVDSKNKIN